jgi:2-polyprenyl-3-methyl-5-hydroxy-6-metoxy-1,4-benzoquinol methylase
MNYISRFSEAVDSGPPNRAWERLAERWWSDRAVHRFSHRQKIENVLPLLADYSRVMDITRGASVDGVLGILAAGLGKEVTIVSPSLNHIDALNRFAAVNRIDLSRVEFVHCNQPSFENLDVRSAECVTAMHILEHAPHPRAMMHFLRERTELRCIIAVPTCLNPTAWVRMGGGTDPYRFTRGSLASARRGIARTLLAGLQGRVAVTEIVDEFGTATVHRWFFPSALIKEIEWSGFQIDGIRPDSLAIPWSERTIELSRAAQRYFPDFLTSRLGFGTHYILRPVPA